MTVYKEGNLPLDTTVIGRTMDILPVQHIRELYLYPMIGFFYTVFGPPVTQWFVSAAFSLKATRLLFDLSLGIKLLLDLAEFRK